MKISKQNYFSMLYKAAFVHKSFIQQWFLNKMTKQYVKQIKEYKAIRNNTALEIRDKDYARLMVLASYEEDK